ncbi:MAG: transketolase C-terminal domain-containing protein [bacterium]|nr:transketolase C-terminal domain-containing protein [bacterium]
MRNAFTRSLAIEAKKNKNIFLLTGDLGYGVLEEFYTQLPKQFVNNGVSEQHMTAFAAGMALSGKIPIVYSIATFATLRAFEHVRNDICYQNLNVKIVGVGSGLTYSQYGATHQSMEDIGLMRLLPNMVVIAPGDPHEVKGATEAMLAHKGPVYLRIGSRGEPVLHKPSDRFVLGKGFIMQEGKGVALIATGNMLAHAVTAAKILKDKKGIQCRLVSMPTIKPLDKKLVLETARSFSQLYTIEEHSLIGGLGSAVAEVLAENKTQTRFKRIAGPDAFQKVGGWLDYMRGINKLTPEEIVKIILKK